MSVNWLQGNLPNLISAFATVMSVVVAAVSTCFIRRQYKIHYDSELTGYIKKSLKRIGHFSLDCTLVNSGGVPISIKRISNSFPRKKKQNYPKEFDKSTLITSSISIPYTLGGFQSITFTISFLEWDYNGRSLFAWIEDLKRIQEVEIFFQYFVYKTSKSLKILYPPEK